MDRLLETLSREVDGAEDRADRNVDDFLLEVGAATYEKAEEIAEKIEDGQKRNDAAHQRQDEASQRNDNNQTIMMNTLARIEIAVDKPGNAKTRAQLRSTKSDLSKYKRELAASQKRTKYLEAKLKAAEEEKRKKPSKPLMDVSNLPKQSVSDLVKCMSNARLSKSKAPE